MVWGHKSISCQGVVRTWLALTGPRRSLSPPRVAKGGVCPRVLVLSARPPDDDWSHTQGSHEHASLTKTCLSNDPKVYTMDGMHNFLIPLLDRNYTSSLPHTINVICLKSHNFHWKDLTLVHTCFRREDISPFLCNNESSYLVRPNSGIIVPDSHGRIWQWKGTDLELGRITSGTKTSHLAS